MRYLGRVYNALFQIERRYVQPSSFFISLITTSNNFLSFLFFVFFREGHWLRQLLPPEDLFLLKPVHVC